MSHKRHLVGLSSFGWLVVVCVKRFHVWILPDLLTGPLLPGGLIISVYMLCVSPEKVCWVYLGIGSVEPV